MATTRRCGSCKLPLGAGQFITAASQAFHISCFTCSKCRYPISGSFVTSGSQYVCANCSAASAPACGGCGAKITQGAIVTVKGLSFHPQHFACANCGVSLQSGLGSSSNGVYIFETFGATPRAMCGRCHATASGRVCCSCSQPILGQHVVADGRQYHNHCWVCAGCKRELAGVGYHRSLHPIPFIFLPLLSFPQFVPNSTFRSSDGGCRCSECHARFSGLLCSRCKGPPPPSRLPPPSFAPFLC